MPIERSPYASFIGGRSTIKPAATARLDGEWKPLPRKHPGEPRFAPNGRIIVGGFVYIFRERHPVTGDYSEFAKIGKSIVPRSRAKAGINPRGIVCVGAYYSATPHKLERRFHTLFWGSHARGEWFFWSRDLQAACETIPPSLAPLLADDWPQDDVTAHANVDMTARAAGPFWEPPV